MKTAHGAVRGYVELARLSNMPTVLTNVLAGVALAVGPARLPWPRVGGAALAVALLYAAGMILNDVVDAAYDGQVRPRRPIPAGRVSRRQATWVAAGLIAAALAVLAGLGRAALTAGSVLVACIVLYDVLHRQRPWAVALMGMCRGLVYWVAATSVRWPVDAWPLAVVSTSVLVYTVVLTLVARSENARTLDRRRWLAVAMPLIALFPAIALRPHDGLGALAAAGVLVAWLLRAAARLFRPTPETTTAVLMWLSGFCLIDGYVCILLGRWDMAAAVLLCWFMTLLGHTRIAGT